MDISVVASLGGATIAGYLGVKSRRLPSEREVRKEIEDRLDGKHEIPTPLAPRRHEEISWGGDFHITVEDVDVTERQKRRKWLPRHGFTGRTIIEYKFHEREAPTEEDLSNSFLGKHSGFMRINQHIDDPQRVKVLVDTANPDTVCRHIMGTFKRIIMELKLKEDNPDVDHEWLTKPSNTYLGLKDGNVYDIMNDRVALGLLSLEGQERPTNIPPKSSGRSE